MYCAMIGREWDGMKLRAELVGARNLCVVSVILWHDDDDLLAIRALKQKLGAAVFGGLKALDGTEPGVSFAILNDFPQEGESSSGFGLVTHEKLKVDPAMLVAPGLEIHNPALEAVGRELDFGGDLMKQSAGSSPAGAARKCNSNFRLGVPYWLVAMEMVLWALARSSLFMVRHPCEFWP